MGDSSYSYSLTTFSPSGQLLQIEYALAAVAKGNNSVGIRAKNGVVLAGEKVIQSPLIESSSVTKIELITDNAAIVYSGVGPDFRVLVKRARKAALKYFDRFGENQPILMLVRDIANVMQEFTQSGGVRPFGVSLLIAGCDHNGAQLYQVDPSGAFFPWKATAIGKYYKEAKASLDKKYRDEIEIEDAVHDALVVIKEGFEGQLTKDNIEIAIMTIDNPTVKLLSPNEIQDYLDETA